MKLKNTVVFIAICLVTRLAFSNEVIELDTTTIKANTELPKYLYVVPWKTSKTKQDKQRKLRLHNLNGDLFDPVMPAQDVFKLEKSALQK